MKGFKRLSHQKMFIKFCLTRNQPDIRRDFLDFMFRYLVTVLYSKIFWAYPLASWNYFVTVVTLFCYGNHNERLRGHHKEESSVIEYVFNFSIYLILHRLFVTRNFHNFYPFGNDICFCNLTQDFNYFNHNLSHNF